MKSAVIAEAAQIELQRFRLDEPFGRRVIDDEMGEIGLAGHRAKRREFGRGEPHEIGFARMRIWHDVEFGLVWRRGHSGFLAEQGGAFVGLGHEGNKRRSRSAVKS